LGNENIFLLSIFLVTHYDGFAHPPKVDEKCVARAFEIRAILETVFAGHGPGIALRHGFS